MLRRSAGKLSLRRQPDAGRPRRALVGRIRGGSGRGSTPQNRDRRRAPTVRSTDEVLARNARTFRAQLEHPRTHQSHAALPRAGPADRLHPAQTAAAHGVTCAPGERLSCDARQREDQSDPRVTALGLSTLGRSDRASGGGDRMPGVAPRARNPSIRGSDPASGSQYADRGIAVPNANPSCESDDRRRLETGVERKRI